MQQMISQRVLLTCTKILYTCMMVIIMIMEPREPRPHAGFTENVEFEWRYKRIWKGINLKFLCSLTTFCFPFFVWIGPCLNYFSRMRIVFGFPSHTSYATNVNHLNCSYFIYDCLRKSYHNIKSINIWNLMLGRFYWNKRNVLWILNNV